MEEIENYHLDYVLTGKFFELFPRVYEEETCPKLKWFLGICAVGTFIAAICFQKA